MKKLLSAFYTFIANNLAIISVVTVTLFSFYLSTLLRLSEPDIVMEYCDACKYLVEGSVYAYIEMYSLTDGSFLKLVTNVANELLSYNFGTWDLSQNSIWITAPSVICFFSVLFLHTFKEQHLLKFITAAVCFVSFMLNVSFHLDTFEKQKQFKAALQEVINYNSIAVETSVEDKEQRINFKDSVREIHKLFDNAPSKSSCMTLIEMQVVLNKQWCNRDNIDYCFRWIYFDEHPQKINYTVLQNETERYILKMR